MRAWQRWAVTVSAMSLMSGVIGACVGDQGREPPQPTDPPADADETPGESADPEGNDGIGIDWSAAFFVTLDTGWVIEPCEGEAPLACVRDSDRHVGVIELGNYAVDPDRASVDGLRAHAAEFLTGMRDDRAIGCPNHTFVADALQEVQVAGEPGIRAEFHLEDGRTSVERHLLYWTIRGQTQWVMTVAAYAPEGCLAPIGEFNPDDLAAIVRELDRVIAWSVLPAPDSADETSSSSPVRT